MMETTWENLRKLYDNCPIPVIETEVLDWLETYEEQTLEEFNEGRLLYGLFYNVRKKDYPKRIIVIFDHQGLEDRYFTYYHELGHFYCTHSHCPCSYASSDVLSEKHANVFALQQAIQYGQWDVVLRGMKRITILRNESHIPEYKRSAALVMNDDIWQECMDRLENEYSEWVQEEKLLVA